MDPAKTGKTNPAKNTGDRCLTTSKLHQNRLNQTTAEWTQRNTRVNGVKQLTNPTEPIRLKSWRNGPGENWQNRPGEKHE
jgi:hypothetical protein